MTPHQARAIGNEFIGRQLDDPFVTHLQLQKLVYIAYGWSLAISQDPLINERPEAWDNGPVFRSLWDALKNRGSGVLDWRISASDGKWRYKGPDKIINAHLRQQEEQIVDNVWARYSRYDAFELVKMTHKPEHRGIALIKKAEIHIFQSMTSDRTTKG